VSTSDLVWLAVIATGSQLIAVVTMHRLQRRTMLESWRLHRRGELTREERLARIEEEARLTAEVTAEAMRAAQVGAIRDEVKRAVQGRESGG